jgi:hypothetical protein
LKTDQPDYYAFFSKKYHTGENERNRVNTVYLMWDRKNKRKRLLSNAIADRILAAPQNFRGSALEQADVTPSAERTHDEEHKQTISWCGQSAHEN